MSSINSDKVVLVKNMSKSEYVIFTSDVVMKAMKEHGDVLLRHIMDDEFIKYYKERDEIIAKIIKETQENHDTVIKYQVVSENNLRIINEKAKNDYNHMIAELRKDVFEKALRIEKHFTEVSNGVLESKVKEFENNICNTLTNIQNNYYDSLCKKIEDNWMEYITEQETNVKSAIDELTIDIDGLKRENEKLNAFKKYAELKLDIGTNSNINLIAA
jgi:hypothetical protein